MAIAALVIFVATYFVMAVGRLPGYRLDRAGAALLGATLMVAFGVIDLPSAYQAIDGDTIALLLGMMIVVANLRLAGFFRLAAHWVAKRAGHPLIMLGGIVAVVGLLSAFLVNDAICLVMTPLVLDLAMRLKRNPVPYLLAVAMASNAGSVATITGNPQNMIIGSLSHVPYVTFAAALTPVALMGLVLTFVLLALIYRTEFTGRLETVEGPRLHYHGSLVAKSLVVLLGMVALFFAGQPVAKVALLGGALLRFTRRVRPEKVYLEIDWPLLVMFGGLFVVVAAFEKVAFGSAVLAGVKAIPLDQVPVLALATAVLSNIVSNVPAVLVLKPFVAGLADPQRAWLVVAMASTLAGNFTLVGSVANLIVAERAKARGVTIGFWPYFAVGAPLTLMTLMLGTLWLMRT
jgi:Na+/H+ antiporter NhaD/arsenite permease-like protein